MKRRVVDALKRLQAANDVFKFEPCGKNCVRSTLGFEVERVGRFELRYRESMRAVRIPVDPGADALVVEMSKTDRWEPPYENEKIDEPQRRKISVNVAAALHYLRIAHRME